MVERPPRLVLASASPRRAALLRAVGLAPVVRPAQVDETPRAGERPSAYVARLAGEKAAGVTRVAHEVVLAADTTVVCDDRSIGKPDDAAQARALLRLLSGRSHDVLTGVAVQPATGPTAVRVVRTEVAFRPLDDDEIAAYVTSGEAFGKAGGYGIQGSAAGFVRGLDGGYTNVMGLPLAEALSLLAAAGVRRPAPPIRLGASR